nr:ATP-binding protein [uncultured Anaerosporobacter sp.]
MFKLYISDTYTVDLSDWRNRMGCCKELERTIITTYRKSIWRKFIEAIEAYDLIHEGDRIAVCITGDKDSLLLAKCMQEFKLHGSINIELGFFVPTIGYNKHNCLEIMEYAKAIEIPVVMTEHVKELGCNKIALCHHFNNVIETILMGMLYNGQVGTMMPKLHNQNYEGLEVIRPLYLVREEAILRWSERNELRFFPCEYVFSKSFQRDEDDNLYIKRADVKDLIKRLLLINSNIDMNIFKSMYNVNLDTMISYEKEGFTHHFLDNYESK